MLALLYLEQEMQLLEQLLTTEEGRLMELQGSVEEEWLSEQLLLERLWLVEEGRLLELLWSVEEERLSEQLLLERLWLVELAQLSDQRSMVVMLNLKRML